jgi:RHS repeat-associated protein
LRLFAVLVILLLGTLSSTNAFASPPSNAIRFQHDADGRLKAAIDPEGDTAVYNWDAAGNLLSITRHSSSKLAVVQLNPARAQVGATVTIEGTGFATTPASDTVKFNGTAATVSAASATSLTVKVPSGATTGPVTVSTPEEGPVESAEAFTVLESLAPSISSISPTLAVAGEEVTVSGSHFDPSIPADNLTLNQARPEMTSASSSTLKFKVPTGTLGGNVSVSTAEGSSTGPDLFIPPNGLATSKVGWTGRLSLGESKTVGFEGSEKVALLVFDGTAGRHALLSFSESTVTSGTVSIWSPSGAQIASSSFSKAEGGFLEETAPLPVTGTYTVLLTPSGTAAGSVKVTSYDFPGTLGSITPAATAEGTTQHVGITIPGQAAHYAVTMSAGERVALRTNNSNFTANYTMKWLNSKGETVNSLIFGAKENWFWDTQTFATAGTYTLVVDPSGSGTGSVDLQLWEDPDLTGQTVTPSSAGGTVTSTIKVPGQRELITFSGTKEQSFSWKPSESSIAITGTITLLRPNGATLASGNFTEGFRNPTSLPETGTYTFVVDPAGTGSGAVSNGTGSIKIGAYEVTGNPLTPAATAEGTTQHFATSFGGQAAHYAVSMSAGERVALKTNNANLGSGYTIKWLKPNGETVNSLIFGAKENWFWDTQTFATAGTYTLLVDPNGSGTGSVDIQLWEDPDLTGQTVTPSTEGSSVKSTIKIPGQRELVTFAGTKEQRISWATYENTISAGGTITLMRPSGASLASGSFPYHEPVVLPETGTYTFVIDPASTGGGSAANGTGSLKFTAYINEDLSGSITPAATAEGTTQHLSLIPGQNARYSVTMSAGERVALKVNNSTFTESFKIQWLNSKGEVLFGETWGSGQNFFWDTKTFASAGTYTLLVDPTGASTGSVDLQLWEDPDLTGQTVTPSGSGGTVTSTIKVPGQRELITFSGTKEQSFSWKPSESSISAGGTITLLRPSGATLASGNFTEGFRNPLSLPETGTYTFVVDPASSGSGAVSNGTGSVKIGAYEVSGNAVTPPATAEGTTQHFATSFAGQVAHYAVTMSAGERVALKTNNSNFTANYTMKWLNSKGETVNSLIFGAKENWFWDTQTFASAGTYTLVLDPNGAATGSVDIQLWEDPDLSGQTITPSTEGGSVTSTIKIPGQRELITFAGTASQLVTVKATESTIASGTMWVLKPDGTKLSGSEANFTTSTNGRKELTLPTTGSYTVVIDPPGTGTGAVTNGTGSVKVTVYLGSHVAWFGPTGPSALLVDYRPTAPMEPTSYSDISLRRDPARAVHPREEARISKAEVAARSAAPMRKYRPTAGLRWNPPQKSWGHRSWFTDERPTPWATLPPLKGAGGETALAGQVLEQNGTPLKGVQVHLEGSKVNAQTDQTGRFLLAGVPSGKQILLVDGNSASGAQRYGNSEIAVELASHETTPLEYTIWLTALDPAGDQKIASPTTREITLRTPKIPGLEVKLPAGTVIRNAAGRPVRHLNITAIPVDRTPSPLPVFQGVALYYTIQPGHVTLSKGARIIYPNWTHLPPGQRVSFWNYNAKDNGWFVYGHGSVSPDGKQIVPDPGVRIWNFSGAMLSFTREIVEEIETGITAGDPVDLYSGLFDYKKRDLVLPDTIPIVVERTYRQEDSNSYSFGKGTQSLYDMEVVSNNNYKEADLLLPDSRKVHYVRISEGTGYKDAVYRSTNLPGAFFGSTIRWDASVPGWDLELTNGLTLVFGELAPLQAIRNARGEQLTLTRLQGQTGPVTKVTSPHGRWVKFTYDGSSRIVEATDNGGQHLKYSYTNGLLTSATDLAGHTTEYGYDSAGNMTSATNARGNKFLQTEYEANGRVKKQTTAGGASFEFAYKLNEAGKATSATVTDPRGTEKTVQFDSEGHALSETVAPETEYEETQTYEVQPGTGLLLSITDPLGRRTSYEYDSNGNVTEVTEMDGTAEATATKFAYSSGKSWMTEEVDPFGHAFKYQYGPYGELLSETDPLGRATTFSYANGELQTITDSLEETTTLGYSHGDLVSVTDPLGRTTSQVVDSLGRVLAVTSPAGRRTSYGYDENGNLTSEMSPSGAKTSFGYDADGNLSWIEDPREGKTTRSYDSMDRLESETDPLGHTAEWSYDLAGDLASETDRNGKTSSFSYDPLRRLTSASYGDTGEGPESTIAYGYDEANRPISVEDSESGNYTLSYDNFDQLTGIEGPPGAVEYAYDAAGRREEMTASGQEPVVYSYDKADQLTGVSRGSEAVSLAYDKAGRTESITLPDGVEELYGYNAAGETTSISYEGLKGTLGDIFYAYDPDGLLEAEWGSYARLNLPEALGAGEYNAANELVKRGSQSFTYDKEGNLLSDGGNEYAWNARGELTGISGGTSASFEYDPFGRRIAKTLGGTTTDMLYDGENVAVESVEGSASGVLLSGLEPDQLFARTTSAGTDSYLTDRLGSTVALANSSGEIGTAYTYDPFGATTASGPSSSNPFQFTGRENDGTGLQYNRARYYNPATTRFISQDPSGFNGSGSNLYWYANGDPLDFIDPSGEFGTIHGLTSVGQPTSQSPGAISTLVGGVETYIYMAAGGDPDVLREIRELPKGRSKNPNWEFKEASADKQVKIFKEAENQGGPVKKPSSYPGKEVELPDGTRIGHRQRSDSGGPTIDVNPPKGKPIKVHEP